MAAPAALYRLRLTTPRLELRVPAYPDLIELREVAHAGVHPPEQMPFAIPWTDEPYSEDFVVAYYGHVLASWRPEDWRLPFGVWAEGRLAGIQAIVGEDFANRRRVHTGSWLGQAFQGQGYGTEMRAAVLELAFRGLGVQVATSGAMDSNPASRRVSEKLGYRVAGRDTVAPRGKPVPRTLFEITAADWRCPIPVDMAGLDAALPLFLSHNGGRG